MPGLKLMAELGLDGSGFAHGFVKAKGYAEGAGEGIKNLVIGAVGIATVEEAIRRTVETAKELVETSERLAIAPEQLQVMRQAAKQSNIEFEKLAETFEKVDIARQRALIPGEEGKDARRAFAALGISTAQLRTQGGAQLLTGSIRQNVLNRNPEELGVIFRELGVKGFGKLIPFLKTDFDELGAKMKKIGAIMDTETAVKLKSLSDEFSLVARIITSQVGPALIKFAEWLYTNVLKLGKGVAGEAGFLGAGTAKKSGLDAVVTGFRAAVLQGSKWMLGEKNFKTGMAAAGFDLEAAQEGQKAAQSPWDKALAQLAAFQAEMKRRAEELDHPKPADLSASALPPKMSKRALETPTNSLLRIGNFLGSSQGLIMQINQRKVSLLQQIANNTKPVARQQKQFVGDIEPTFFPIA